MTLLSNEQKAAICRLARRAYDTWAGREAFEDANDGLSMSKCFEAWRRVEQGKAVGRQSLRDCTSDNDYLRLTAHFQNLLGDSGRALNSLLRHGEEPRVVAFHKLQLALRERGLHEGYAAAICRRQFRCELGDASAKQLWNLFFTVKNRRVAQFKARPVRRVKVTAGHLSTGADPDPF